MKSRNPLIRPLVRELHAYVPGEQPKIKGLIKLNTNENPYPPSPKVLAAVKKCGGRAVAAVSESDGAGVARKTGEAARLPPENIIVGNGSDELLALACGRSWKSVRQNAAI
jgi:histidinol-phosphate aminotransferase